MDDMKILCLSFLEEYIPNKKSKVLLVLSITLSTFLLLYPEEFLKLLLGTQPQKIELTTRLLPPSLTMLLGISLAYYWTCLYYRSSKNLKYHKFHKKVTLNIGEYYENKEIYFLTISYPQKNLTIKSTGRQLPHHSNPTLKRRRLFRRYVAVPINNQ